MNTLLALILTILPPGPTCGDWAAKDRSAPAVRKETKRRMLATARAMGVKRQGRQVLKAMVARESRGDPCAVHVLGEGEYGLGPLGESVRWTLGKWDRSASPSVLHIPEVATVIAVRIMRRAVRAHGAKNWIEVNSVFATGRVKSRPEKDRKFCALVATYGVDCTDSPLGQLGTTMGLGPVSGQDQWISGLKHLQEAEK